MRKSVLAAALAFASTTAFAQDRPLDLLAHSVAGSVSAQAIQVFIALTVLSLAPTILLVVTSFTRFVIALSFLRSGLGLQSTPANMLLIALSVFMSVFVMAPTFHKAWREGVAPYLESRLDEGAAFEAASAPFRDFMVTHVRDKDYQLFRDLAPRGEDEPGVGAPRLDLLVPAFMISELRRGFEIGVLILAPFLIIDLIVAIVVMSMGMMMVPPSVVSLPLKVLFFVLIDGWNLLVGSLIRSYG